MSFFKKFLIILIFHSCIFRVDIPDIYKSSTYGEICKADATAVDLGKLNKYYYEFGRYAAHFDKNGGVGSMVYEVQIFIAKLLIIFDLIFTIF